MSESLAVVGSRSIDRIEMDSDDYVSASIRVFPTSHERLVLTVDGEDGGWLEMIVSTSDGAVEEVTITGPLPTYEPLPTLEKLTVIRELPRIAIEGLLADSREVNLQHLVAVQAPLGEGRRADERCIRLAHGVPTTRYETDGLAFLAGPEGLQEMIIRSALADRAAAFA